MCCQHHVQEFLEIIHFPFICTTLIISIIAVSIIAISTCDMINPVLSNLTLLLSQKVNHTPAEVISPVNQ